MGDPVAPEPGRDDPPVFPVLVGRLRRDTARYAAATLVPAAISVVSVSVFTRLFDPLDYGRYSLAMATTSVLGGLLGAWIQTSVLRYLPRYAAAEDRARFLGAVSTLLTSLTVALAIVGTIVFLVLGDRLGDYRVLYFPSLLLLVASMVFEVLGGSLMGELRSGRYSAFAIANSVIRFALALGFVLLVRRDVVGIILGAALAAVVVGVPMARGVGITVQWPRRGRVDTSVVRELASYGLPMVGWAVGAQVLALSDRYMVAIFRDAAEVGIYSANYALATMGVGLVATPLIRAAHPLVMNAWERGHRDRTAEIVTAFSRYYLLTALAVVAVASVLSSDLTSLLLGAEFREGYVIIPLVLAGSAVWGFANYGHKGLELAERTRMLLLLVTVTAVVNVVLNLLLVPRFGYVAAAATTLASYLVYPVLVYAVSRNDVPWVIPWSTVARAGVAAALAAAAGLAVRYLLAPRVPVIVTIVVVGLVASLVYLASLIVLGEPTERERRMLRLRART